MPASRRRKEKQAHSTRTNAVGVRPVHDLVLIGLDDLEPGQTAAFGEARRWIIFNNGRYGVGVTFVAIAVNASPAGALVLGGVVVFRQQHGTAAAETVEESTTQLLVRHGDDDDEGGRANADW
jgi:hypothetical protein